MEEAGEVGKVTPPEAAFLLRLLCFGVLFPP